jgi:DNA polymerase-3 subunit delta
MAKSGATFKSCLAEFERLTSNIRAQSYKPIYLLMGEESYFIDALADQLAEGVLGEVERSFCQTIAYGLDVKGGDIVDLARQLPMMGDRQVIIVREAQQMDKFEELASYAAQPSKSTILVLCYKSPKGVDKRQSLYKHIASVGEVFESVRPRDYEIKDWLGGFVRSKGINIEHKGAEMIADHIGNSISKIANELEKLIVALPEGTRTITPDHIEAHIGISKEFNCYELNRAILARDTARALTIADHMSRNPKNNPLVVTIMALFGQFKQIFILNYYKWLTRQKGQPMPSDAELCRTLGVPSPYFVGEIKSAAALYPNKVTFKILGIIREYDARSKGIGGGGTADGDLLREMILKIVTAN